MVKPDHVLIAVVTWGAREMTEDLIPDPEAVTFLQRRSAQERHALARLLDVEGEALAILKWIVDQPACDQATIAMTFWRLRGLPPRDQSGANFLEARNRVLESIAARLQAAATPAARIAWDGREAWTLDQLIAAPKLDGIIDQPDLAARLTGPFGTEQTEPASFAFFEEDYGTDDIFDSMWRTWYADAAIADWLEGKPADVWLAALEDLYPSHPTQIFEWMVRHPQCPDAVAASLYWEYEHKGLRETIVERWRTTGFPRSGIGLERFAAGGRAAPRTSLPEGLAHPTPGRDPAPLNLREDFIWWAVGACHGGLVPRPRAKAEAEWRASLSQRPRGPGAGGSHLGASSPEQTAPPTQEKPTQDKTDRNFGRLNLMTLAGAAVTIGLWRTGFGKLASLAMIGLIFVISAYLGCVNIGGFRRTALWLVAVGMMSLGLAFLFRYLDKGVVL